MRRAAPRRTLILRHSSVVSTSDCPFSALLTVTAEPKWAAYIPGGYSLTRCLKLSGRPMMYAILFLAGMSINFFGYDASVMSQVNTNPNYLRLMGAAGGSDRDAAAVGGIVSIW